jgi:hypothetical protein
MLLQEETLQLGGGKGKVVGCHSEVIFCEVRLLVVPYSICILSESGRFKRTACVHQIMPQTRQLLYKATGVIKDWFWRGDSEQNLV